ncbi:MAG: hypothetical protein N3D73_00620 [Candidatus Diapherotrites archaeon]|nr:hypothetical protein [Candidatus Diapherotrites archaeon]
MNKKELKRQIAHIGLGIIIISLFLLIGKKTAIITFLIAAFGMIILILTQNEKNIPIISEVLEQLGRKNETIRGIGAVTFFLGLTLAIALFSYKVSLGCLIILVFGDAASTIIGTNYGKIKITKEKTLEGSLAFLVSSFILLLPLFGFIKSFFVSLFATLVELIPLDDNIVLPIMTGTLLSII